MSHIRLRDHRLNYIETGSGNAVLFIHGFTLDSTAFLAQVEALRTHHRCVAMDLWGHGGSDCPPLPWSWPGLTNDLLAFIHRLRLAPCHLVGHGGGGVLALQVALDHPELVRSLVLIATPTAPPPPEEAWLYRVSASTLRAHANSAAIAGSPAPVLLGERTAQRRTEVLERDAARVRAMPAGVFEETLELSLARDDVRDRLSELQMPVLVIPGESDRPGHQEEALQLARSVTQGDLVGVPGVRCAAPFNAPHLLTAAITRFLDSLEAGDGN